MSLTLGLDVARSSLGASSELTSTISRNIANAGNGLASRKIVNLITSPNGGVLVSSITRVSNDALARKLLASTSDAGMQSAITAALDLLDASVNDPELESSVSAYIGKFSEALQTYANAPNDLTLARAAISAAGDVVTALNAATFSVQAVRQTMDAEMAGSVDQINTLLARFATVNATIVQGSRNGSDVTDQLDARDAIVRDLSEHLGVRVLVGPNNDMQLFTDSGLTLFDKTPRPVTFQRTAIYGPSISGNSVYVDGVPVTGSGALMELQSGRLRGLAEVRDGAALTYQNQLDEIARGLIEAFAEQDQSAVPALPDQPGLFTYSGAPAMPAGGTVLAGLAGQIRINANVDPAQGGNAVLLRDGSISDPGNPAYTYNTTGAVGFTGRLQLMIDSVLTTRSFDPASELAQSMNLVDFSSASIGWLQQARQTASSASEYQTTLLQRSTDALSREIGVNLDEEMSVLLEVERAFQASTKIIGTIDSMFAALLESVR